MPLHRSLLFWAGVLILLFCGWAWWDSLAADSSLSWDRKWLVSIRHADAQVQIYLGEGAWSGLAVSRYGADPGRLRVPLPAPFVEQTVQFDVPMWNLGLPHWLLMLAVAGCWLPLLVWRRLVWKRKALLPSAIPG